MIGTCALCQKNADLQNSHLIPKWAYRRVCNVDTSASKAPVYIADGNAALSNNQTTKYLLCADCEQRFAKSEDYLARLTDSDNGQIKLFRNVTRLDTPKKVLALLNLDEDSDHIAYFAASVMWRGCVMTGGCKLGPYESKFRQYLLGATHFPREASITVGLFEQSPNVDARGWVSEPTSTKTGIGWLHGFLLAGLAFRCWVGKAIPQEWQNVSLAGPNPKKYVSIVKPEECADFLAAAEMAGTATPRGKLARLY
ncbi:MAG: hypothetical protein PHX10_06065 [Gallionellaceae bacterium]|nr:hypothetical protein [Gallionellaceae bacterium]